MISSLSTAFGQLPPLSWIVLTLLSHKHACRAAVETSTSEYACSTSAAHKPSIHMRVSPRRLTPGNPQPASMSEIPSATCVANRRCDLPALGAGLPGNSSSSSNPRAYPSPRLFPRRSPNLAPTLKNSSPEQPCPSQSSPSFPSRALLLLLLPPPRRECPLARDRSHIRQTVAYLGRDGRRRRLRLCKFSRPPSRH